MSDGRNRVEEAVRHLGACIQADRRYLDYFSAKEKAASDAELQDCYRQYTLLMREYAVAKREDASKLPDLEQQAVSIDQQLQLNESRLALSRAQIEWHALTGMVYGILSRVCAGEDPKTCSNAPIPNCANCPDCCGEW